VTYGMERYELWLFLNDAQQIVELGISFLGVYCKLGEGARMRYWVDDLRVHT